jgi:hypothetical protein
MGFGGTRRDCAIAQVDFAEMDAGEHAGGFDGEWSGDEDEGMEDLF